MHGRFILVPLLLVSVACAAPTRTVASWYGEEYRGLPMADRGRPFNPDALTCASWYYPFGTVLEVRHGQRVVYVVVTDRGPAWWVVRGRGVTIDLSRRAFELLGPLKRGLLPVTVAVAKPGGGP